MPLLGSIIKSAIELTDKVLPDTHPVADQKTVLTDLLNKARSTAFGKHYAFDELLLEEEPGKAFAKAVPYFDYHQMHEQWWQRQLNGEKRYHLAWQPQVLCTEFRHHRQRKQAYPGNRRHAGCHQEIGYQANSGPGKF